MLSSFMRRALCAAALFMLPLPLAAQETATSGEVAGSVTSADGRPVAGARIELDGPTHAIGSSDADGRFLLKALLPGTYSALVTAARFTPPAPATIDVRGGSTTSLTFSLARSESSLTTIGRVSTNGRQTVSTSSTPVTTIDTQAYADQGYTRISDVLQDNETTTLFHTTGGGSTVLPTSVAIRGPDPTETLVDIDGHQINNGNTGDFDLSLLDPADYSSVELVRGISPSSLVGPDTIDGAINIRTVEPTIDPHGILRLTLGSYGAFGGTMQTTGTVDGRLGYVLSLHRQGTDGEVNEDVFDQPSGTVQHVGSAMLANSELGKLRYAFGGSGAGYVELSFHDQNAFRDLSAGLTTYAAPADDSGDAISTSDTPNASASLPLVDSFAGTTLQTHNAGYGIDVSVPLGSAGSTGIAATTLLLRHYTSLVDESVFGPGAETTPYLFNSRDLLDDETLQIDHRVGNGALTLQYEIRNESLATDFIPGVVNEQSVGRQSPGSPNPLSVARTGFDDSDSAYPGLVTLPLGQTQRSLALRYTYNPTPALHFIVGGYYSQLSLFGNYLDPRFGFVFTPDSKTAVRLSAGTTFQSPQLPELVVPNPLPVVVGNYISVGNPNLKPDQATEYGLGFDRIVQGGINATAVSADFYRVNLRQPASPLNLPLDANCGPTSAGGDGTACPLSYPVNAGDGVYQGIELSARHNFGPYTTLRAGWAVRSAYLTQVPADIQDGTLVVGEQSAGLPLHKATLSLNSAPPLGFTYGGNLVYESLYNELNLPQFATLSAHLGYRFRTFEIDLAGTNLTNVYDQRFTTPNGGVIYGGLGQAIPQDAYALQGTTFTFTVLRRF
jgi:outer membrane receptor protein involved in Fe transport